MEYNGFEAVLSVPRKYPEVDVWFAMIGAASVGPLFSISGSNFVYLGIMQLGIRLRRQPYA
jgi:hypothetical protein